MPQAMELPQPVTQEEQFYETQENFENVDDPISDRETLDRYVFTDANKVGGSEPLALDGCSRQQYSVTLTSLLQIKQNTEPWEGQRRISKRHVKSMYENFKTIGSILSPITVIKIPSRNDYQVLDGQHRLMAVEKMNEDDPEYFSTSSFTKTMVNLYVIKDIQKEPSVLEELFPSFNLSLSNGDGNIGYEKTVFEVRLANKLRSKFGINKITGRENSSNSCKITLQNLINAIRDHKIFQKNKGRYSIDQLVNKAQTYNNTYSGKSQAQLCTMLGLSRISNRRWDKCRTNGFMFPLDSDFYWVKKLLTKL